MRSLYAGAISGDAQLQAMGLLPTAVYAGDVDSPQERPFINLKWGQSNATPLPKTLTGQMLLTVWVHDLPNDYSRISAMLRRIRQILESIEAVQWQELSPWSDTPTTVSDTGWIYDTRWTIDSTDLTDDGHGTIARWSVFSIMSNG